MQSKASAQALAEGCLTICVCTMFKQILWEYAWLLLLQHGSRKCLLQVLRMAENRYMLHHSLL